MDSGDQPRPCQPLYGITDFDLHTIETKRLRYESGERGLLREAMTRALSRNRGLSAIRRASTDLLAPFDPENTAWAELRGQVGMLPEPLAAFLSSNGARESERGLTGLTIACGCCLTRGALRLATRDELPTNDNSSFRERDLLANLQHSIPTGPLHGRADELATDVAFAEVLFIHGVENF